MTAATYRNTGHLSVPLTQNTAPVFEFNCLYSHDIRRKQKRWQDGFLKYHTFNKRIMVYDVPRNLIGSMHWLGEEAVQEGDELRLEKGNALVQVADKIGQSETDLTGVKKSKNGAREASDLSSPMRAGLRHNQPLLGNGGRNPLPLKHKSLNAVLGTPRGPIGKAALPTKSPFEQRNGESENERWTEGRPAKRQRMMDASAPLVERSTTTAKMSHTEHVSSNGRKKLPDTRNGRSGPTIDHNHGRDETRPSIDLCHDTESIDDFDADVFSDSALPPSSPTRNLRRDPQLERRSSPLTSKTIPAQPLKRSKARDAPQPKSPGFQLHSSENSRKNAAVEIFGNSEALHETVPSSTSASLQNRNMATSSRSPSPPRKSVKSRQNQVLRLPVTAPKRKTLLCQEQVKPSTKSTKQTSVNPERNLSPPATANLQNSNESGTKPVRETLSQRLQRIDRKHGSTSKHFIEAQKPEYIDDDDSISSGTDKSDDYGDLLGMTQYSQMDQGPEQDLASRLAPAPSSPQKSHPQPILQGDRPSIEPQSFTSNSNLPIQDASATNEPCDPQSQDDAFEPVEPPDPKLTAVSILQKPEPRPVVMKPFNAHRPNPPRQPNIRTTRASAGAHSRPLQTTSKSTTTKKPEKPEKTSGSGAWSREAFDLFVWRPPNWDEEKWCLQGSSSVMSDGM